MLITQRTLQMVFYKAGILRDSDWNGDLSSSLQAAVNRWVLFDCKGDLVAEGLGLYSLCYTDNIESVPYISYNPNGSKLGYMRGGLIVKNRFNPQRYNLGFHCDKFNAIEPNLGFEIFIVLASILYSQINGITPYFALETIREWEEGECIGVSSEDQNRALEIWGFSSESVLKENPKEIFVQSYKTPPTDAIRALTSKPPDPYFGNENWMFAHTISLKVLEMYELYRRLATLPSDPDQHHTELTEMWSPTVHLNWHPGVEDGLARWADTYYQYEMDSERSDMVFMRGFWIPPRGVKDKSLSLAIKKMQLELKILSILHEILFELGSDTPVPPPIKKRKKGKTLMNCLAGENEEGFIAVL